jgi:hypothetical protein
MNRELVARELLQVAKELISDLGYGLRDMQEDISLLKSDNKSHQKAINEIHDAWGDVDLDKLEDFGLISSRLRRKVEMNPDAGYGDDADKVGDAVLDRINSLEMLVRFNNQHITNLLRMPATTWR